MSSSSRMIPKQEFSLERETHDSPQLRDALSVLLDITSSAQGPWGKIKMVQNSLGGHITMTSTSKRLFSSISISKPVIRLIITAAQGHLATYDDAGLFIVKFATHLIIRSLESDINRKLLPEIYEKFLHLITLLLDPSSCPFIIKTDIGNVDFMLCCVKSIIQSKPLIRLQGSKLTIVAKLLLEVFLNILPKEVTSTYILDNIHFIYSEGVCAEKSFCTNGLLIDFPEVSSLRVCKLSPRTVMHDGKKRVKVAIIIVSMSGDVEEVMETKYEWESNLNPGMILFERHKEFCTSLEKQDVGLVLCQKVIHPKLKSQLTQSGIIVVDRLGLQQTKLVLKLTDAVPVVSVLTRLGQESFGYVDNIEHEIVFNKSYLRLKRNDKTLATLFLCHSEEEQLQEFKEVCHTALTSLYQLLHNPYVLCGGGCWQTSLGQFIQWKVHDDMESLQQELECSSTVLSAAAQIFSNCLQEAALHSFHRDGGHMIDECGHLYINQVGHHSKYCCCRLRAMVDNGHIQYVFLKEKLDLKFSFTKMDNQEILDIIKSRGMILDNFSACLNAFKTAVLTACTVLKIGQYIHDAN
ncbi:hypothetical protein ACJMK2_036284 [Sinanodonta woodiana]|uniref:McKusick-Kaufman syndrome n=1 Tax=Sinanodonta woodiana TaxID=1069815 RepID=A0ABD3WGR7_SINWO